MGPLPTFADELSVHVDSTPLEHWRGDVSQPRTTQRWHQCLDHASIRYAVPLAHHPQDWEGGGLFLRPLVVAQWGVSRTYNVVMEPTTRNASTPARQCSRTHMMVESVGGTCVAMFGSFWTRAFRPEIPCDVCAACRPHPRMIVLVGCTPPPPSEAKIWCGEMD